MLKATVAVVTAGLFVLTEIGAALHWPIRLSWRVGVNGDDADTPSYIALVWYAIAESIKDPEVASEVAAIEENEALDACESREQVKEAIDRCYTGAI